MADFCQDCCLDYFGKDTRDLAGLCAENEEALVLCEHCGVIIVDHNGKRLRSIES
jgi:hypothetical protein